MSTAIGGAQSQCHDRSLWDLHESLLHFILARLDVYSLPSCAQVCKSWSLIITRSPAFARLHASLHSSHSWFTLFSSPSLNSMVFYDTLATRCISTRCLDLMDGYPSLDMEAACLTSQQVREYLTQMRRILKNETLLATSQGLLLSRSELTSFTVTNIVTRKAKLLPSPNPQLRHIAFVGMTYFWTTMSYQVLLCGLPRTRHPQPRLITCVYNSLTHCWTNATSTLSAEFCVPFIYHKFARPRTCVWFEGHFHCVMGRALHLFNLETMEWGSVYSLPLHKALHQPPDESMQVCLPSELLHFYCLWEHKGKLLLAGSLKNEESKFVTQLWCFSPSLQTGCGMFQWQAFARLPLIASEAKNGPVKESALEGRQRYAHGDTLCLIDGRDLLETSMVHFCVHHLAKGDLKTVKSIPSMDVYRGVSLLANLAIQPCPFTSP